MQLTFNRVTYLLWGIFFTFWFLYGARSKAKVEQQESLASRLSYFAVLGLAISLIAIDPLFYGPLLWRVWPRIAAIDLIGVVLLILGLAFAVWARLHLGRYWSARISLAEDHQLIQTGPYRLVRNPIYLGALVAGVGTAIVIGELRGMLAIVLMLIAFIRKIRLEERWLAQRFGPAYMEYCKRTRALIPFVY